jgi:hypothetical protein
MVVNNYKLLKLIASGILPIQNSEISLLSAVTKPVPLFSNEL